MEKITRSEAKTLLYKFIVDKSNIPNELLIEFKKKLLDVLLEVQDEVFETFIGGDEELSETIVKFFENARDHMAAMDTTTVKSIAYTVVDVPIIVPIEVFAMCSLLNKQLLAIGMAKISELFVNEIVGYVVQQTMFSLKEEVMLLDLMKNIDKDKIH